MAMMQACLSTDLILFLSKNTTVNDKSTACLSIYTYLHGNIRGVEMVKIYPSCNTNWKWAKNAWVICTCTCTVGSFSLLSGPDGVGCARTLAGNACLMPWTNQPGGLLQTCVYALQQQRQLTSSFL